MQQNHVKQITPDHLESSNPFGVVSFIYMAGISVTVIIVIAATLSLATEYLSDNNIVLRRKRKKEKGEIEMERAMEQEKKDIKRHMMQNAIRKALRKRRNWVKPELREGDKNEAVGHDNLMSQLERNYNDMNSDSSLSVIEEDENEETQFDLNDLETPEPAYMADSSKMVSVALTSSGDDDDSDD